jgi:hypothetical protein
MVRGHCLVVGLVMLAGLAASLAGGCSGQYEMAASDQLVPAGAQAPAAARLTRQEFWVYRRPIRQSPVRFWMDDQPQRAAFTDRKGYAAVNVPAPAQEGAYPLVIAYQDTDGDEVWVQRTAYVWPAEAQLAAVDLDQIDLRKPGDWPGALGELAKQARLVYLTSRSAEQTPQLHARLQQAGLPDGPILLWDTRSLNDAAALLTQLRGQFPNLGAGVGKGRSARVFEQSDLQVRTLESLKPEPAAAPGATAEPAGAPTTAQPATGEPSP